MRVLTLNGMCVPAVIEDQTVDLDKLARFAQLIGDLSINEAVLTL
ncbi:hypothetical protein [Salinispora pacifica]|nr:hypothetical protein [Salinispora pacifica]